MWSEIITALRYYLQIKATAARYALQKQIEADIEDMEAARDGLRLAGDPRSQLRADILQQRILRAQGIAAPLAAAGPPLAGGPAGSDA